MEHEKLTEQIIGCAYRVYNKLGFGFLESVYEKCLMIELRKKGIAAASQAAIVDRYDDEVVGEFVADIVVEGTIIVELKSVRRMALSHEIQLVNYLAATRKDVGLLLTFGHKRLEVKRKVREL